MAQSAAQRRQAARRVSPRGERFEVLGRAAPIRRGRAPAIRTEAREELLVIKDAGIFLCARPDGDIHPARVTGEGLYSNDTRYLSELRVQLGGRPPVLLSYEAETGYQAVVNATNSRQTLDHGSHVPQQTLGVGRVLALGGRLYHQLELCNFAGHSVSTTLEIWLAADFADVFEVRGVDRRAARGHALAPKSTPRGLLFAYVGEDEQFRETVVEFDPKPEVVAFEGQRAHVSWPVTLEPAKTRSVLLTAEPSLGGKRGARRRLTTTITGLQRAQREWEAGCSKIETDNELFDKLLTASLRDLHALMTPSPDGAIVAAGIPWYVAPFGRDSLLTAQQTLMLNPEIARQTLLALARLQAHSEDPWRDAEPGKILHELRSGELAGAGIIPHTPYYGSVDATPLFIMLAASYHRWTGDTETLTRLRPALDAAIEWIDRYGDRDGDGFVEYEVRSSGGLRNQGWKDSGDSVMHADGTLAEGPIALVEVQGYVYLAKLRIADVYEALGAAEVAARLRGQADDLRTAFNEAFWDPDEGTFVLALDGRKRQVRSVTSNPGHCLYCGIVGAERAAALAERLMAPDMFSGWGIRTLSSQSSAYNPMSYHNGSVWPHDNAVIAAGLKRYGFHDATERIATALFDVAVGARDFRLPELYCGFDRLGASAPVAYPVACIPQAWAAATPFMLLQAMLGVSARAGEGTLAVNQPALPGWLRRTEIRDLRVAGSKVSLAFERDGGITGFSLLEQSGPIRVNMAL
ncbi:MAG TPA: glycogen debranching N-terminal domain-containing protein [Solirubrobacterales bacterium]|nr:glycogen debranching N-terminal domain-containing protein [Solirubrobacterales bacterium]